MSMEIVMPKAGLTMVEGTISEWKVAEGAQIRKGDVIMEYENEKNIIEYESIHGGFLHIVAQPGEVVKVGKPIAYLSETKEEYDALLTIAAGHGGNASAPTPSPAIDAGAAHCAPVACATREDGHIRATGLARKTAREAGIDLADVPPTSGPDGRRIAARDVKAYLWSRKVAAKTTTSAAAATDDDGVTEIPWTGVRMAMARNMLSSLHQSAQCTAMCEIDVTDLLALRAKLVERAEYLGCKITVNDLLCMATCKVLKMHPLINATFDGSTLYSSRHVNLSLAVATEAGLMVPVIRKADTLSLVELSRTAKDLSVRAREKKLKDGEQSGGTFTVSNVGMFPIHISTPILNSPEVGIFGFGRAVKKPMYTEDGVLAPRDMMWVYLTFDHRVIDGLETGRVFQDLQYLLEAPELITV